MSATVFFNEYVCHEDRCVSYSDSDWTHLRFFREGTQEPKSALYAIEYMVFKDEDDAEYWRIKFNLDVTYACVNSWMNALVLHRPIDAEKYMLTDTKALA